MPPLFRIYFQDKEGNIQTYDGDPFKAPSVGIIAIVQKNNAHGRYVTSNFDIYCWKEKEQEWVGMNWLGFHDYLAMDGHQRIAIGRMIPKEQFYKVVKLANEDPDFPKRTGWQKEEVRY